jgi:hypothetical protein
LEWFVECECGWTCRGGADDIVAACTEHARDEHGMELTREQVFAVARPVEDASTWGQDKRHKLIPPGGQLLGRTDLGSGERDVHDDHLS